MTIPVEDDSAAAKMEDIDIDIAELKKTSPTVTSSSAAATDDDDDDNASKASAYSKQPLKSVTPTFGKIFALLSGEVHLLIVGLVFMCISEAATLTVPILIGQAYDALQTYFFELGTIGEGEGVTGDGDIERATMGSISYWMGIAIGVYFVSVAAGFVRGAILGILGERLVARLRRQVYESVLQQEIGFFDETKTGEIVSRLGSDTQLLQSTISTFAPEALVGMVKVIFSIALMYTINGKLTSVSLAGMVVLCLLAVPFGQKLAALSKTYQDILGEAQTASTEALGSIRTVQSFAAEPKELKRFVDKIGDPDVPRGSNAASAPETTYSVGSKKAIVQVGVFTLVFGGAFGFLYLTLWYGFYLVTIEGTLSLGGLSAFQSYIFIIGGAIGQTVQNITQVFSGVGASGRVFYLLERQPEIKNFAGISDDEEETAPTTMTTTLAESPVKDAKSKPSINAKPATTKEVRRKSIVPTATMEGSIVFENVMFSYPTRPDVLVLNAFSLHLAKDTTTALVGSSGSGKSTVVSLIQRFYDTDAGTITLDGVDITHLDLAWLRSQIGYVQQEPQLFGINIRDNLTYGLSEEKASQITQIELENACRDANAHEFISSWPEGYDTMVGERGITLSGGQKQRVAIARALLTNCRILLLDEATSALDAESEHEVQKAIENAMVGRTVVVVAHRLSTIHSADQIVVMDNRKIVDIGTHESLLDGCKRYQDLIKRQSTMTRDVSIGTLQKMLPKDMQFDIDEE